MKLTIAIPTYNRANRLYKSLSDLCDQINLARNKFEVSVFVSDNGSTDGTAEVIDQCSKLFSGSGIPFFSRAFESNQGFDSNVLACYLRSVGEYVWFLSDDDNIIDGAIDAILNDIIEYQPYVIYYNHDQKPYDMAHPYIKDVDYFKKITDDNIRALQKITNWPKLTTLVIKKCDAGCRVVNLNSYFAHVTLALQCGLVEGGVLHSPVFTAAPDSDYESNVDFVPYVGNNMDIPIKWVLQLNNKMHLCKYIASKYIDPLTSSLNTLGAYYRGQYVLTDTLKNELWKTVWCQIRSGWIERLSDWRAAREIIKFPISIVYGIGYSIIARRKITKNRN